MRMHKFLSATVVMMLLGVLLAACGGTAATPTAAPAAPTAAPAAPKLCRLVSRIPGSAGTTPFETLESWSFSHMVSTFLPVVSAFRE